MISKSHHNKVMNTNNKKQRYVRILLIIQKFVLKTPVCVLKLSTSGLSKRVFLSCPPCLRRQLTVVCTSVGDENLGSHREQFPCKTVWWIRNNTAVDFHKYYTRYIDNMWTFVMMIIRRLSVPT